MLGCFFIQHINNLYFFILVLYSHGTRPKTTNEICKIAYTSLLASRLGGWCPNRTRVHDPQKTRWPPTTQGRLHIELHSPQKARWPPTTQGHLHMENTTLTKPHTPFHEDAPSEQHGLQLKPRGCLPCERHPFKGKPPSMHLMAEYRAPPTFEGPPSKFPP